MKKCILPALAASLFLTCGLASAQTTPAAPLGNTQNPTAVNTTTDTQKPVVITKPEESQAVKMDTDTKAKVDAQTTTPAAPAKENVSTIPADQPPMVNEQDQSQQPSFDQDEQPMPQDTDNSQGSDSDY